MERISERRIRDTVKCLEEAKVFTVADLSRGLNCSTPSARRKLRQWEVHTSYNRNGRYYTLPTVPRFNENGLWSHKGIRFSRHGNLKKTVVHLVGKSASGLSGKELSEILGVSARSFLHHFRDVPGLCRQRHEGVYVYYSDAADRQPQQEQNRVGGRVDPTQGISDMEAIMILVALIKHHRIGVEEIVSLRQLQGSDVSRRGVELFLERHGLVKKTPDSTR
jgi:AraC-like DNA-binding protein